MAEYIERETFLKNIEERYCLPCKEVGKDHNGCRCRACWVDDMCGDVIDAPAADVAPVVHGRWEPYFEEVEIYNAGGVAERKQTGWICGRCKSVESITRYYKTNYCPNCGAKMDLEALQ